MTRARIAVAGAGIYGASAAIRLAEQGHLVCLFDPIGILRAASAINQYRIHAGYHYPRSPETIQETLEARVEFMSAFEPAIVRNSRHFYAIPKEGSRTPADLYEQIMRQHGLALRPVQPSWMNFEFIDRCYEVEEHLYDPDLLREQVTTRLQSLGVAFKRQAFTPAMRSEFDFVAWATYGMGASRRIFRLAKYQVAEKILMELPPELHGVSLVIVDGPFTAFDPYGSSPCSLFGSAKNTNHWTTTDPEEPVPEPYCSILNQEEFRPVSGTRFETMKEDCSLAIPLAKQAKYLGSRFTIRVVENSPESDRRILYVKEGAPGEFHIFSGKVVSAVKAARLVCERIAALA
jgi:hypothetical protein